ncbi:MAG: hypothetical protein ACJ75R_01805 [Solirubrobacterales bacterium]
MRGLIDRVAIPSRRVVALAAVAAIALLVAPAADAKPKRGVQVSVMTRNLFLGADLGPALNATGFQSFIEANGGILREVDQTNFPVRAKGLAGEIKATKPQLVGLQEVALWRTGPFNSQAALQQHPVATTVKYDFLKLLLNRLNAKTNNNYKGYRAAVVQPEFDFEAPADYDGNPSTGTLGAELNGRLTMRDVILVRKGAGVKVTNPTAGHFHTLFTPTIAGVTIPVIRGWAALDATVTKGKGKHELQRKFRFVDTHLEAFDDETQHPSIRALQAQELIAGMSGPYGEGPGGGSRKVILVGDLNSNVPGVKPGDEQAYQAMLDGGFTERSTSIPPGCCVPSVLTGPPSAFDHQVDHVMTNQPTKKVKLVRSEVTGLTPMNGFYDSDHAGLFSVLKVR